MKPIDRMCPACKVPPGVGCLPFGVKPGCGYPMKKFHSERSGVRFPALDVRWNTQARAFFVEYGNARFSVTRNGAIILADALREAVKNLTVAQYTGHEED